MADLVAQQTMKAAALDAHRICKPYPTTDITILHPKFLPLAPSNIILFFDILKIYNSRTNILGKSF